MEQDFLSQAEFADNPEPRCPVVLLLDTSGSMSGRPIQELNEGLQSFETALKGDKLASLRVEVAIVTFGGKVQTVEFPADGANEGETTPAGSFTIVHQFNAPKLKAGGGTPMGSAVQQGLTLLRERKEIYKQNGIDYFRPWMFLITDGQPTDSWEEAALNVREEETRKGLIFFGVGVEGANFTTLQRFSDQRQPLKLKGLAFEELFTWLSKSLSAIAHSKVGEQTPLPPVGWADVDTAHS